MLNNFPRAENTPMTALRRLWRRLSNELVQDVPEEIALCEFDCRKLQCTYEEWASCPRRLGKAEGELSPVRHHV
jgi:hypothetical protein